MSDQTILSASGFVNSIGVNTHAGFGWTGYNNLALMVDDLEYLGVTHLRDAMGTQPRPRNPSSRVWPLPATSSTSWCRPRCPQTGHNRAAELHRLAPEVRDEPLRAASAPSRGSTRPITSPSATMAVRALPPQLSSRARSIRPSTPTPTLGSIPVYNLSLAYNDPQGYSQLGNMSGSVDYANAHAYVSTSLTTGSSRCGDAERRHDRGTGKACRHHRNRLHHARQHPISRRQRDGAGQIDPEHAGRSPTRPA